MDGVRLLWHYAGSVMDFRGHRVPQGEPDAYPFSDDLERMADGDWMRTTAEFGCGPWGMKCFALQLTGMDAHSRSHLRICLRKLSSVKAWDALSACLVSSLSAIFCISQCMSQEPCLRRRRCL